VKSPKTTIIVNESAYAFRRRPALADRIEALARGGAAVRRTRSLDELAGAARELARDRSERVVFCGGDGSFMAGVTALVETHQDQALPEIVLAPGGTVATVAKNFGQHASLLDTVRRVLDPARPGSLHERPTLRIVEPGVPPRIGFIFGTGLVARFFERYYAKGAGGYAAAAKIVARIFVGSFVGDAYSRGVLEPMPCTLTVDGSELAPRAYSLVVCAVVRDLGLHLLVTHRAGEDPERPHLVASPLATRALGPQAPRVLAGKPLVGDGNFDSLVERFTLQFPDDDGPYVLDGDVFRAREVSVTAGPRIRVRTY
jgi:diacylglycerol kinase family enzyme